MKRITTVLIVTILCLACSSMAFDGNRKGFVLGGGLGFTPSAEWGFELGSVDFSEDGLGFGLHLVIGGAFDEHNMLVYEGNVVGWKSDVVDTDLTQGFNGAAFYHYFGPVGKSAFAVGGIGFYVFNADGYENNDPGFGMLLGGGYEFARHWQAGVYFSFGKTSDPFVDYNHHHISILVSGIAF
ncbi:MAG: hypothetical protein DRP45_05030 [Candidatus Zixiibacteriota bacterium]|nr:MAG: hypothetical protein DRP45_05030 [candidate division Zixibacteria bacterium]